jgi:hypothetical protein
MTPSELDVIPAQEGIQRRRNKESKWEWYERDKSAPGMREAKAALEVP